MKPKIKDYDIEAQTITITLHTGDDIQIDMIDSSLIYHGPGYDIEIDKESRASENIFFDVGAFAPSTARSIIEWAERNHSAIHHDAMRERAEERQHREFLRGRN